MNNLFLVTSALHSNEGIIGPDDRFEQTIECLENLRNKVPDDIIVFTDGSPNEIPEFRLKLLENYVNAIILWNKDQDILNFSSSGRKSQAEILMLYKVLNLLKDNQELNKLLSKTKRIFKYSSRTILLDDFDINSYDNLEGKYVFKKAIPSWMPIEVQKQITDHLYITRFYSFCISLIDDYLNTLPKILDSVIKYGIDTEHSHFKHLNKSKIIEFENLYCEGIMAGTALKEIY